MIIMEDERSIEFEIIKEPWNKYQIQDNSVLKTRTILKSVKRITNKEGVQYLADMMNITAVRADPTLKGAVNLNQISNDEIAKNIEKEDMQYNTLAQEFNEYLLDDGTKIKIHTNVTSISRSSLKDKSGDPIYYIQSGSQISIKPVKRD